MNITAPAFSRTSNCHWCWAASSGVFGRCLPPAGLCFVVVKIESTQHEYIHAAPLAYCCLLLAASDACLLLLAASDSCLAACLHAAWCVCVPWGCLPGPDLCRPTCSVGYRPRVWAVGWTAAVFSVGRALGAAVILRIPFGEDRRHVYLPACSCCLLLQITAWPLLICWRCRWVAWPAWQPCCVPLAYLAAGRSSCSASSRAEPAHDYKTTSAQGSGGSGHFRRKSICHCCGPCRRALSGVSIPVCGVGSE